MPVTKPLPRIGIEEYLRGEETAEGWELHTHTGGEILRLTALDFEVPVDSVYAGVLALSAERAP